jgi:hypothetical protein
VQAPPQSSSAFVLAPHLDPAHMLLPPDRRTVQTVSRPSLKISRHDDREPPGDVTFEVWDPIGARYEPKDTLDAGLFRLDELAERVRLMVVQHDPARTSLKDAPDPAEDDDTEWAELRASSQAIRVYETRTFYRHGWTTAMSRTVAIETICDEVGYIPP